MRPRIQPHRTSPKRLTFAATLLIAALPCLLGCDDTTSPPPAPATPSDLVATVSGAAVHLTWTTPAGVTIKVMRRLNADPSSCQDHAATLIYAGDASQADDSLGVLLPDTPEARRSYHYAAFGCDASGCESSGSHAQVTPTLMQCLAAGGYTIYFNHATATLCQDHTELGTAASTTQPDWWKNCESDCSLATTKQLSQDGIDQATQIGVDMQARHIPIGTVLSSEFCRCVQTAQYMGLGTEIPTDPGLTYFVYDEEARCAACMGRLARPTVPGTNTVLIGHAEFTPSCPVLSGLAAGEAAIYKPDGVGGTTFVTRVLADDWATLP